jgi:hypothetical protein
MLTEKQQQVVNLILKRENVMISGPWWNRKTLSDILVLV